MITICRHYQASVRVENHSYKMVTETVKEAAISRAFGEALEGLRTEAMKNERKRELLRKRMQLLSDHSRGSDLQSNLQYQSLNLADRIALAVSRKFTEVEGSLPTEITLYGRKVFAGFVAEIRVPFWDETYFAVIAISSGTSPTVFCSLLLFQSECNGGARFSITRIRYRHALPQGLKDGAQWHVPERLPRGDCCEALLPTAALRTAQRAR